MCTDNMPSGTAMRLGDVLTIRGGKTVEVMNTDAEGRLVMADGLVLAIEDEARRDRRHRDADRRGDARPRVALAPRPRQRRRLVEQVKAAARRRDEPCGSCRSIRRYRKELDSKIADIKNVGGDNAGTITAACSSRTSSAALPWAHLDIAGRWSPRPTTRWRPTGATGFGTRLLAEFAAGFHAPVS